MARATGHLWESAFDRITRKGLDADAGAPYPQVLLSRNLLQLTRSAKSHVVWQFTHRCLYLTVIAGIYLIALTNLTFAQTTYTVPNTLSLWSYNVSGSNAVGALGSAQGATNPNA
ncbi:MAG: hypothetical protein WB679_12790, partial [Terracidiphilus sp.]